MATISASDGDVSRAQVQSETNDKKPGNDVGIDLDHVGEMNADTDADDDVERESRAAFLKEIGNASFREGNYANALEMYSSAIELCPSTSLLWCNRSMCHAAMGEWKLSVSDAQMALKLDDKYEKAWYRLVKGLLELKHTKEAGQNLLVAYKVTSCCRSITHLNMFLLLSTDMFVCLVSRLL